MKKQEDLEKKKDKILSALDLNEDTQKMGKLAKAVTQQRSIRGAKRAAKRHIKVSWDTLLSEKEKHVVPLNLNIDLRRLTQLFGRSLYIKYFIKNID